MLPREFHEKKPPAYRVAFQSNIEMIYSVLILDPFTAKKIRYK